MLMAIYLIAPVFSPWIVSASRKGMELFLAHDGGSPPASSAKDQAAENSREPIH
jgi:hypothetical protein